MAPTASACAPVPCFSLACHPSCPSGSIVAHGPSLPGAGLSFECRRCGRGDTHSDTGVSWGWSWISDARRLGGHQAGRRRDSYQLAATTLARPAAPPRDQDRIIDGSPPTPPHLRDGSQASRRGPGRRPRPGWRGPAGRRVCVHDEVRHAVRTTEFRPALRAALRECRRPVHQRPRHAAHMARSWWRSTCIRGWRCRSSGIARSRSPWRSTARSPRPRPAAHSSISAGNWVPRVAVLRCRTRPATGLLHARNWPATCGGRY